MIIANLKLKMIQVLITLLIFKVTIDQYIILVRKASIMATSEAQKRASAKYRKNNVKAIMFNLYPSDSDLIEFLEGKENRSSYIKELIRKDMNNSKN